MLGQLLRAHTRCLRAPIGALWHRAVCTQAPRTRWQHGGTPLPHFRSACAPPCLLPHTACRLLQDARGDPGQQRPAGPNHPAGAAHEPTPGECSYAHSLRSPPFLQETLSRALPLQACLVPPSAMPLHMCLPRPIMLTAPHAVCGCPCRTTAACTHTARWMAPGSHAAATRLCTHLIIPRQVCIRGQAFTVLDHSPTCLCTPSACLPASRPT